MSDRFETNENYPDHVWDAIDRRWLPKPKGNGKFPGDAAAAAATELAAVELECAANIKPELILWLWKNWLALGKLHIIAGQPGVGKSTIALKIAAATSAGGKLPDGTKAKRGSVIIWSGEDDAADTLIPRLEASGADMGRVHIVRGVKDGKGKRPFDPSKDVPGLLTAIKAIGGASLVIVDPIVIAIAADSHKNAETRRGLQPLVDLSADLGAALLGVTHFTKGTEGRSPIDRVTGSLAFGALSRVVMIAAKKQDEDGKPGARVLMLAKSNIGPDEGGFEYELQNTPLFSNPEIIASVVVWGGAIEGNARDVLAEAETVKGDDEDERAADRSLAKEFLLDLLMDGPLPTKDVKAAVRDAGHSWRTLGRAKSELKILTGNKSDGWTWSLPQDQGRRENNDPTPNTLAELADIKKVKENQVFKLCQDVCQAKNVGGDAGRDESSENQEVKSTLPTLPTLPGGLESDPLDLIGDEAFGGEV
jgi:putative DNA primase/helicase